MSTVKEMQRKPDSAPPSRTAALGYAAVDPTAPLAPFRF